MAFGGPSSFEHLALKNVTTPDLQLPSPTRGGIISFTIFVLGEARAESTEMINERP